MKSSIILTFSFITILLGCKESSTNQKTELTRDSSIVISAVRPIETIIYDLNNDNKKDTIILSNPPEDPGQFQKITILITGKEPIVYTAKDNWDYIDKTFRKENKNQIESDKVFIYKQGNQTVILLFGFFYGTGRDEFSIIEIKDNNIQLLFDGHFDTPLLLSDLNEDGKIELVGRKDYYEIIDQIDSLESDVSTYAPFYVYTINNNFILNEEMTHQFNEDNYIWAGLKYSDTIKVLYPKNGDKPTLFK